MSPIHRLGQAAWRCAVVLAALASLTSAKFAKQLVGLELASFEGREVIVMRTSGDVPAPGTFSTDPAEGSVSFILRGVGGDDAFPLRDGLKLVSEVQLTPGYPDGVKVKVLLKDKTLADQHQFRFSQPSPHLVLLEFFPASTLKADIAPLDDPEKQLGLKAPASAPKMSQPAGDSHGQALLGNGIPAAAWTPEKLGLQTLDLRSSSPQAVLGLAAMTGLLDMKGRTIVATEGLGEMSVGPAGQSLANWSGKTPPGELYLSGSPEQIADFLERADKQLLASQPSLGEMWADLQPRPSIRANSAPASTNSGSAPSAVASRRVPSGDSYSGLNFTSELPGGGQLSDVRVTLPASSGYNLYDVLQYLSEISGIAIMIDPYAFDQPTGSARDPLVPDAPAGGNAAPGFRSGSVFEPSSFRSGTVVGNLTNVPFDQALQLILETHDLQYVVYGGGDNNGAAQAASSGPGGYSKPVILVTSKERLEEELQGQNEVNLTQFHYADPNEMTQVLDNLNLLPSSWFVYQGSGGNGGGSGGGGNGGGSGSGGGGRQPGGGGNGGGGGGGGRIGGASAGNFLHDASSGALFYRGSTREPIYERLREAVSGGKSVIRVLLRPEQEGLLVTGLSL